MELKGSKTEKNLLAAFAGESQARNKYTYFASVAKKKGTSRLQKFFLRPPTTKRNTPKCGLRRSVSSETPL